MLYEEPMIDSCKAIHFFISKYVKSDKGNSKVNLLMKDLLWRCTQLRPLDRSIFLAKSFYYYVPDDIRTEYTAERLGFDDFREPIQFQRPTIDIAIVTILEVERAAVLRALGRTPDDAPDFTIEGRGAWLCEIQTRTGAVLSVLVTMVGVERNVMCAIAVTDLCHHYDIGLLVLVGIAAGPRTKVKLGDVVYAERVYDYEHVRLELRKFLIFFRWPRKLPRPEQRTVDALTQSDLEQFRDNPEFHPIFKELLDQTRQKLKPVGVSESPTVHDGTIAAGEKLFADGSLEKMLLNPDQRIRAGAQEDMGFALAAISKNVKWCIFRGICDYGDPKKDGGWHTVASLAAATAAVTFLSTKWRQDYHIDYPTV